MSALIIQSAAGTIGVPELKDPNFASVTLLAGYDGTNGSTSYTSEVGSLSASFFGTAALSSTDPLSGATCVNLGNNQTTFPDNDAYEFGSGDFVVEMAWKSANTTAPTQFKYFTSKHLDASRSWEIYWNWTTNQVVGSIATAGGGYFNAFFSTTAAAMWSTTWHYLALQRSGNELSVWVDGVKGGTTADVTGVTIAGNNNLFCVGGNPAGTTSGFIGGFADEIRVTKGVARYTGSSYNTTRRFPRS